jgi:hypothetical protein
MRVKFPYSCGSYHETCKEFLELALRECGYSVFDIDQQPEYVDEGFYVFDVNLHGNYVGLEDERRLLENLGMADFEDVVIER